MNKIFNDVLEKRNGHYCHALEVNDVFDLECTIECFIDECGDKYTIEEYIEFFRSMELYCLSDDKEIEEEVFNFDFNEYIESLFY